MFLSNINSINVNQYIIRNAPKLILYGAHLSHPTRAVMMTAKELGLGFRLITVDVLKAQQQKEQWFLKVH